MRKLLYICILFSIYSCKQEKKEASSQIFSIENTPIEYAKGFTISKNSIGVTTIEINSPWPQAETSFKYALVPKSKIASITLDKDEYDAIVPIPVENIVATSTTHVPTLEMLGEINKLVGFPDTQYISSKETRKRIDQGFIKELGNNESINTELVIELQPEFVMGFAISGQNKAYETLERSNIPVVYNGDWTEETPLGKAEWIKFFAPFFQKEQIADSIFSEIKNTYNSVKELAKNTDNKPTILSGALYKDVWYIPGGRSWAATFLADAHTEYAWSNTTETGSLHMSIESILAEGKNTDFWVSPSHYTSYQEMREANVHYTQFSAFKNKKVYTFANTKGETGGLLYFELAPTRPDWVLKDLIHIFHPEVLPDHELFFFKPLN